MEERSDVNYMEHTEQKQKWKTFFLGVRQFILALIILFGIFIFPVIGMQTLLQGNKEMAYMLVIVGPYSAVSWLFLLVNIFWYPVALAVWTVKDALQFKKQGIRTMPLLWGIGMILPMFIPIFTFIVSPVYALLGIGIIFLIFSLIFSVYYVLRDVVWRRKLEANNATIMEQEKKQEQKEKVKKMYVPSKRVRAVFLNGVAIAFVAYITYVIYMVTIFPNLESTKQKTQEQVVKIHATKLTLDDVIGKNLPPDPGAEAEKTIAGIDANNNGIRDDVELAIFKEYPDSAKTRAAYLQYAMALQIGLTQVFNSETLVAMAQETTRARGCLDNLGESDEQMIVSIQREDSFEKIILNTDARKNKLEEMYDKYMVSHGDVEGRPNCDIDPASLPN